MDISFVAFLFTENMNDIIVYRILLRIHLCNVLSEPSVVGVVDFYRGISAKVSEDDLQTAIQKSRSLQSCIDLLKIELDNIAKNS